MDCISGAISEEEYRGLLQAAGFTSGRDLSGNASMN